MHTCFEIVRSNPTLETIQVDSCSSEDEQAVDYDPRISVKYRYWNFPHM